MYAVMLGFNETDEEKLKKITYKAINDLQIEDNDFLDGILPHITICTYEDIDKNCWINELTDHFKNIESFYIEFESIGVFSESGTVYLSPIFNEHLYDIHKDYQNKFKHYKMSKDYYGINKWVPHCTILNKLSRQLLINSVNYIIENVFPMKVEVSKIVITEMDLKDSKFIGLNILKEIPLIKNRLI